MVLPFMTLYLTQKLGYSISRASLVMSIYGAGAICGGIVGGKLSDRFGFYNIQLLALIFGGTMFITLGQVRSFTAITGCTFILALVNESFRPANAVAIAHYSNEKNKTRGFALSRLATNLGWSAGGALGGFFASHSDHLLFWVDGLTSITAALLLRAVLSPSRNAATPTGKKTTQQLPPKQSAYRDKPYLAFIVLTALFGICFFQLFATVPVYFKENLRLTAFTIGSVFAFNGLVISLVEMPLVYKLEQRNKYMQYIFVGTLLCGLSFIVLNLVPGTISTAMVFISIVTFGEMLALPFMNTFWINRTTTNNRGQYAGLFTVAWSVAQVIGPYSGGQIAEHLSYVSLWWIIGSTCLLCALGYKWLQLRALPDN